MPYLQHFLDISQSCKSLAALKPDHFWVILDVMERLIEGLLGLSTRGDTEDKVSTYNKCGVIFKTNNHVGLCKIQHNSP